MTNGDRTTRLLQRMAGGDDVAADELFEIVYEELRGLAGRLLAAERAGHTLQPTALIHEAWLKLGRGADLQVEDRGHFVRLAARAMRRVLVDHARGRGREKRGAGQVLLPLDEAIAHFERSNTDLLPLDEAIAHFERSNTDLLALDDALERLGAQDLELARIVELHCFGGLTHAESAATLGLTERQVRTRWAVARGWLARELGRG